MRYISITRAGKTVQEARHECYHHYAVVRRLNMCRKYKLGIICVAIGRISICTSDVVMGRELYMFRGTDRRQWSRVT